MNSDLDHMLQRGAWAYEQVSWHGFHQSLWRCARVLGGAWACVGALYFAAVVDSPPPPRFETQFGTPIQSAPSPPHLLLFARATSVLLTVVVCLVVIVLLTLLQRRRNQQQERISRLEWLGIGFLGCFLFLFFNALLPMPAIDKVGALILVFMPLYTFGLGACTFALKRQSEADHLRRQQLLDAIPKFTNRAIPSKLVVTCNGWNTNKLSFHEPCEDFVRILEVRIRSRDLEEIVQASQIYWPAMSIETIGSNGETEDRHA